VAEVADGPLGRLVQALTAGIPLRDGLNADTRAADAARRALDALDQPVGVICVVEIESA
jgi:hypothetical protein